MALVTPWLSWLNGALLALQLCVHSAMLEQVELTTRQHTTLLTLAPYSNSVWVVIYLLLVLTAAVDCAFPSLSFFSASPQPTLLRSLFALSCLVSVGWILAFSQGAIHSAVMLLIMLWVALLVIYAHVLLDRRQSEFSYLQLLCSGQLGLNVYFVWICVWLLLAMTALAENANGGALSLCSYQCVVSVLTTAALLALVQEYDVVFGLIGSWALTAMSTDPLIQQQQSFEAQLVASGVRASCLQGAQIVLVFLVLALLRCVALEYA